MITSELLEFLRKQLRKGIARERLREVLLAEGGWSNSDLDEAFAALSASDASSLAPSSSVEAIRPARATASSSANPVADPARLKQTMPATLAERVSSGASRPQQNVAIASPQAPLTSAPEKKSLASDAHLVEQSQAAAPAGRETEPTSVSPHEDFLGIFAESKTRIDAQPSPPVISPARSVSPQEAPRVAQETQGDLSVKPSAPSPVLAPTPSRVPPRPDLSAEPIATPGPGAFSPTPSRPSAPTSAGVSPSKTMESPQLTLAPGEDFLGIFSAIAPASSAGSAPTVASPVPAAEPIAPRAPLRPPPTPTAVPRIMSELKRPEKILPHTRVPSINIAALGGTRPIMSAPPSKGFISPASKTIQPTKPLPPRPIAPPAPVVSVPATAGVAPGISASMLTDEERRAQRTTAPRRISTIAPPKRTFQDILARAQGQQPLPASSPVPPVARAVDTQQPMGHTMPTPPLPVASAPAPTPPEPITKTKDQIPDTSIEHRDDVDPGFPKTGGRFRRPAVRLGILLMTMFLLLGAATALYVFVFRTSNPDVGDAIQALRLSPAFSYGISAKARLAFENPGTDGEIAFELVATGTVQNTPEGIGDGMHSGTLSGIYRRGEQVRTADLHGDVRVVADTVFLYAKSAPVDGKIDPSILKRYWISIPMTDIARDFSLVVGDGAYKGFIEQAKDTGMLSLLFSEQPFVPAGEPSSETLSDGTEVTTIPLSVDPAITTELIRSLVRAKFGRELFVNDEDRAFLAQAWKKISATLSVDADGFPRRFTLDFTPNDRLFGVQTSGMLAIELVFAPLAGVEVTKPMPSITLTELEGEVLKFQEQKALDGRDALRIEALERTQEALEKYKNEKGRYPTQLSELIADPKYAPQGIATTSISELYYYGYLKANTFTRNDRCTFKSDICPAYHIGVDLENPENPFLDIDADISGDIVGADTAGCALAPSRACLDRTQDILPAPRASEDSPEEER